jgi:acetyl-CoA carboxylase biotin carboxyl carrier protein
VPLSRGGRPGAMSEPGGLSVEDVRRILEVIDASHFGELRIEIGELRIYARKTGEPAALGLDGVAAPDAPAVAKEEPAARAPSADDGRHHVTAPMVGIFYRAPAPGRPPFVEVGDEVGAEDTVCLIEVMKLYNSVVASVAGRVEEVLVEDGAVVAYGQALLAIAPAEADVP